MGLAGRWQLHPLHLYLVRYFLKLDDLVLPLEGPTYGRTTQQVGEIAQREYPTMEQLGIVVADDIDPELAEALTLLTKPHYWVDSLWFPRLDSDHMWRTVAVITEGDRVVLGVQTPGETERFGGTLTVEIHEKMPLPQVLLPTLPPAPPGNRGVAKVPVSVFQQRMRQSDEDEGQDSFMQSTTRRPASSGDQQLAVYDAIAGTEHVRAGQIAANMRDRNGKVKRSTVLKWFDNAQPDGRYLDHVEGSGTGEQLMAFTPADARLIGAKINELVTAVR